jgi:hypothetical protein
MIETIRELTSLRRCSDLHHFVAFVVFYGRVVFLEYRYKTYEMVDYDSCQCKDP